MPTTIILEPGPRYESWWRDGKLIATREIEPTLRIIPPPLEDLWLNPKISHLLASAMGIQEDRP